jgi:DNA-binding transcriptional ArsR family regulator
MNDESWARAGGARPLSVGEIVSSVDVGQSTVSEHLRRLAETCFVLVEHRGTSSYFQINERCIECFPSAAELVMGNVGARQMPTPRPGATRRRTRSQTATREQAAPCETSHR